MVLKNEKQAISNRIKTARLAVNMPSVKVSQAMKLSDSMCSQWERGISNPSTAHLIRLAEVLQVSFEWLATGDEYKENQLGLEQQAAECNTQAIKINQLLGKMNGQQKDCLIVLLNAIVN